MKKFFFAIICEVAFVLMTIDILSYKSEPPAAAFKETEDYRESYNSEKNISIARNIAAMTEAKRVAVIGNDEGVLIGIALKSGTGGRSALREKAESLAKEYYPKGKIVIEIQTDKAEKIFSLASYLEKGIPEKVLSMRISYLLGN